MLSRVIEVGSLRTHFVQAGTGRIPLVLLHGGGFDSSELTWGLALEPLSARLPVLAPDLPGYGQSDKPRIDYNVQFYVCFLREFLVRQGWESIVLCGFSMGGMVSAAYALRFPELVRGLVLVDAAGLEQGHYWRRTAYLGSRIPGLHGTLCRAAASAPGLLRLLLRNLVYRPDRLSDQVVAQIRAAIRRPGAGRAWEIFLRNETLWTGFRTLYAEQLSQIQVPTLLIHGAQDRLVPLANSISAHKRIESSHLEVIEGCGHWCPREKPEAFCRPLFRFLDGLGV